MAALPSLVTLAAVPVTPAAPFLECPAIGENSSCAVLVDVTDSGNAVLDDPTQGPYDGSDDTLIGVINNSSTAIKSLQLASDTDLFGFDGDGICSGSYLPVPAGCPFGSTGYEGPNTSFSNINQNLSGGTVNFTTPLAPGATAYFSLEERLAATSVTAGGPSVRVNGGPPNALVKATTPCAGKPVNCATGDFWHTFTDATVPGRGVPLNFQRTYDAAAATVDGPFGFGWTDSYATSMAVDSGTGAATITLDNDSQVVFQSNGSGGFSAAPWVEATLQPNGDGTFTLTTRPDQIRYVFSASGQLLSETDRNNYSTTLNYTSGQLTTVTDPAGRALTLGYTGTHVTAVTDPLGRKTTYSYDSDGNLASSTDAAGEVWKFTYDSAHQLLTMTDPRGGTTSNVYDSSGRVTSQSDPLGRTITWAYVGDAASPGGGTTTVTDPAGNVTVEDFTNLELIDITHASGTPLAATTSYAYDPATLGVTSTTDPNGHMTTSTFDADGNQTSTTDALGRTTLFSYDTLDDVTSKTTPAGQTTSYGYDGSGNLVSVTDATGHATTFTYGDATHPGDVTQLTDRDGRTTTITYDAQGDVATTSVSPTSSSTDTITSVYDADGEMTCQASPNATAAHVTCPASGSAHVADTTSNTFDSVGRITATTDPNGHTISTAYDADGDKITVTDADGNVTTNTYDADNEVTATTRADGTTLSYSYDKNGNQTSQTDGAGNTTAYSYDALNRQISVTDPLGHVTKSGYDLAGNKTSTVDPSARTTSYSYDAANQLTGISYSDGTTHAVTYSYTADGLRSAMTDGTGTTTYAYDTLDRLTGQTNGGGATVQYGEDNSGNVTTLTYPSGQIVSHTYDGASQVTSTTDWLGKTFNFSYDANGNETSQADPNGITAASTYDNADQLTAITDKTSASTLASFSYTRDNLGQVTSSTPTGVPGSSPETYAYSSLNQLGSVNAAPYSYDHADNLIKLADGTTQAFNAANELTSSTPPAGSSTPPSTALAVDQVVSVDQKASSGKITSPVVKTKAANELILAFISADGPKPGTQTITKVAGAGLTWTLAVRANGALGTAEVWQAYATTTVAGAITATLAHSGYQGSMTIETYTGAAAKVGGSGQASASTGAPSVGLTPIATGSIVAAAGHDWDHAAAVTPATGQTLTHLFRDTAVHDSFWTQRISVPTTKATPVTVTDTIPTKDRWELAAVEIVPANPTTGGGGTSGTPVAYTYDAQGNRTGTTPTGGTTTALTYDQANRLTTYGAIATYSYDGDGLRAAKTVSGATTTFTWDQSGSLPLLLNDGADSYVYAPDGLPLEKVSGTTPTYLLHDQQGSTLLLADASGAVVGSYTYNAYGKTTGHTGSTTTNLQYDGQYTDAESGYQYLRARNYDPASGQFISRDPLAEITSQPYSYANSDPTNLGDPMGENAVAACATVSIAGHLLVGLTGNVEICNYTGDFTASTITVSLGVGFGLGAGGSVGVSDLITTASQSSELAGLGCASISGSGSAFGGVDLNGSLCGDSAEAGVSAGPEVDLSASVGDGYTYVVSSSDGYTSSVPGWIRSLYNKYKNRVQAAPTCGPLLSGNPAGAPSDIG